MENINIWFARNKDGDIVTIDKINENNRYDDYSCPICESKLIPKLGDVNAHHLAHKDASKCSRETQIHFFVKNELLKRGDRFTVKLDNESKEYICKEILIEQEYKIEFGTYKPDITIITEDNKTIYFEVAHTNKKKIEDYLDIWIELNNIVVEIETKEMIEGKNITEFEAKFYEGKCFNIKQEDKDYYELVGKLKLNNTKYPKEQVEKLNWLWLDINKYLLGNLEISELSDLIQSIEDKELRKIVVSILKKNKCTKIMDDYIEYNKNIIKNELNLSLQAIYIPRLIFDRIYGVYDIFDNNINEHINLSERDYGIKRINLKISNQILINNCKKHTENIETQIRSYLKNINNFYSINLYNSNNIIKGNINFNYYHAIDLDNYYYKEDNDYLKNNIIEKINNYRKSLDIIKTEDIVKFDNIFDEINKILKKVNPIKYEYHTGSIRRPRKNIGIHKYEIVEGEFISEDKYKAIFKMTKENIRIIVSNKMIDIDDKEKVIQNNGDFSYIKKEIMDFISDKIRKERYKL